MTANREASGGNDRRSPWSEGRRQKQMTTQTTPQRERAKRELDLAATMDVETWDALVDQKKVRVDDSDSS